MRNKPTFKTHYLLENLTYDDYIIYLEEGRLSDFKDSVSGHLKNVINAFKSEFDRLRVSFGASSDETKEVFSQTVKSRTFFSFLKAFGFSIKKLVQAVEQATTMLVNDLSHVFKELADTKMVKKLHAGLISVDELVQKYPALKRTTGLAVVGILLVGWINMTFVGNMKYDFNWTKMIDAFKGNQSLADVLASNDGLMFLGLVTLGITTGIGFAWLGLAGNIILALLYTGYYYSRKKNSNILSKIKSKITR